MRKTNFTKSLRTAGLFTLLLGSPVLLSLQGCTDLEENPVSSITPENFYRNEEEVIGGLASVYAELRNTLGDYYNASQVSSDEHIVPTRGSDWYDNGVWLELDRQTFGANSPSGLGPINGAWNNLWSGVARANVVINALENVTVADKAIVEAELRTLRAFYYYLLMDMFGGVQIVTTTDIMPRARSTRAETFKFIEDELNAARAILPASWPAEMNGRMTKGAADAILASMYLNAEVWTGTVTTAGLQKGPQRWQDAITASDRILNSGAYTLATEFKSNFRYDNHLSPENILVVKHLNQAGLGMNFLMRALHYSQYTPSPWNGFSTLAEVYDAFDGTDVRKQIFLEGCQVNLETGQPVNDRQGKPLCFTKEIRDPTQATEAEGVRIVKWGLDPNHVAQEQSNDFAYFRLAEIMLIKAEALNETGNKAGAVTLINTVRARAFEPDKPLNPDNFTQATLRDQILKERLFEFTAEAKRRQDLIRHGKYTAAWTFKSAGQPWRILMPIPQSQLDTNPLLVQNPGY